MYWLTRLPGALLYLARGGVTSIAGNLPLAAVSIALAASLWLFVTDKENPKEVQTFNNAIPIKFVNVPTDLAVANASETSVRIRIEVPKNDVQNLRTDDFEATVDLGGSQKGAATPSVDVTSTNGQINVVDVTPARIDVTLESLRSKDVPVKVSLVGSPQQGFAPGGQTVVPDRATVTGPESLVALVDSVVAEVNLTGLHVDVTDDRVDLKPQDIHGGEISRIQVSPSTATVSVELQQRDYSLQFVVNPTITGAPAAGYNVAGVSVDPQLVTVTGPLDVLQSIDAVKGITTDEIPIADSRSDVVRQVQLVLPPNVRLQQGASTVRVTVAIKPAIGQVTFLVVPQIRNVAAGLAATPAGSISVTLSGDVPTLQAITPESIVVIADAQGLTAGLHSLTLQITPPAGTTLVRSDPPELGVALTERQ